MEAATAILDVAIIYGLIGAVVALIFVTIGIGRLDSGARGFQPLFRLIVIPGTIVLWPLIVIRMVASLRSTKEA